MKFLVDPLLAYLLLQLAGLLFLRSRTSGRNRGMVHALMLATLLLGVTGTPRLARGLEASLGMPTRSDQDPAPALVVVLAGGYLRGKTLQEDILNAASEQRILEGVSVWRRLPEAQLVLSGAVKHDGRDNSRHSQLMAERAMAEGVPVSALLPEPRSRNTREHPVEVLRLSGVTSAVPVMVVTSSWHTRRAWREFCRHFRNVQAHGTPEFASGSGWRDLLPGAGTLSTNTVLLREWVGILWSNLTKGDLQCASNVR